MYLIYILSLLFFALGLPLNKITDKPSPQQITDKLLGLVESSSTNPINRSMVNIITLLLNINKDFTMDEVNIFDAISKAFHIADSYKCTVGLTVHKEKGGFEIHRIEYPTIKQIHFDKENLYLDNGKVISLIRILGIRIIVM